MDHEQGDMEETGQHMILLFECTVPCLFFTVTACAVSWALYSDSPAIHSPDCFPPLSLFSCLSFPAKHKF